MSYTKMYGRQFIKLPDNQVIPVVLSGSNNCTMFCGKREVLERDWSVFCNKLTLREGHLDEDFLSIDLTNPNSEWFKQGSKWITNSTIIKWIESGIKSARTVEEIVKAKNGSIKCFLSIYNKLFSYSEPGYNTNEMVEYINTTEKLVDWVDKAIKRMKNKDANETIYYCVDYMTWEPLRMGRKSKKCIDGPVVCSCQKGRYLCEFTNNSYTCSRNFKDALIFDNEKDFNDKVLSVNKNLSKYNLISAKRPCMNYVIRVVGGSWDQHFIEKKTRTALRMTRYSKTAKRFISENAANKYINDMLKGRFRECKEFETVYLEESEYISI